MMRLPAYVLKKKLSNWDSISRFQTQIHSVREDSLEATNSWTGEQFLNLDGPIENLKGNFQGHFFFKF